MPMSKRMFLLSVALASSFASLAPAGLTLNEDERCRQDADPFSVPAFIHPFGWDGVDTESQRLLSLPRDTWQCVEQAYYRPVLSVSEDRLGDYGLASISGYRVLANVRHMKQWYVAAVPVGAVESVVFQVLVRPMKVLGTRGAHSQIRVFFNRPVLLTPQWPVDPEGTLQTDELIFTANAAGINEASREDIVKNFDGSLLQARGVHTRETRLYDAFVGFHTNTVQQFRLHMTSAEGDAYIEEFVGAAVSNRMTQRFILTGLNCNSVQFQVLDEVLGEHYGSQRVPFDPEHAFARLKERGLTDEQSVLPPFESEPWARAILDGF